MIKVQPPRDSHSKHAPVEEPVPLGPEQDGAPGRSCERSGMSQTIRVALPALAYSVVQSRPVEGIRSAVDFFMLNGLLITPLISIGGFVALIMPEDRPLHWAALPLICAATLWFFLSLTYSHYWRERERRAPSRNRGRNI